MLETNAHIRHPRCVAAEEARYHDRHFFGHASVTELDLCRELADWEDACDLSFEAAAEAERAAERALENTYGDPNEGLLTAGGVVALHDPQAY